MKITLVTSSAAWFLSPCQSLQKDLLCLGHDVSIAFKTEEIPSGDLAFYLSFPNIVSREILLRNKHNLVLHASDLPSGRGWSPWVWQILEGKNKIPVCLLEAAEKVDAGVIYLKDYVDLKGNELLNEIRIALANTINHLILQFIKSYPEILKNAQQQIGEPSFYLKRSTNDSQLDVNKTILEQFNLLRTVDNESYPAFFYLQGCCYKIKIEKV